jgi:tRNA nucleotidyltransferase/poly(A) polymerase
MGEITQEMDAALRSCSYLVNTLSAERIRDEFLKGVDSAKSVVKFLEMLERYELFQYIFPNAVVNTSFIEEKDHAVLLAWLLSANGIDKSGAVLQAAKYTSAEVKAVKFLVGLKGLNVQTAYVLKKAEANSGVSAEQMLKFGGYIGMHKRLLAAFVDFRLSITGADLKDKVKQGPEMGAAIRDMETKKFEDML